MLFRSSRLDALRPVDPELLQVLGAAYKASKRDDEGYTPLSELGQRAKAVSSFAARKDRKTFRETLRPRTGVYRAYPPT